MKYKQSTYRCAHTVWTTMSLSRPSLEGVWLRMNMWLRLRHLRLLQKPSGKKKQPLKKGKNPFNIWAGKKRTTGDSQSYAVLTRLPLKRRKKGRNRLIHPAGDYWLLADSTGKLKRSPSGFYIFSHLFTASEQYGIGDVKAFHKFGGLGYIVS